MLNLYTCKDEQNCPDVLHEYEAQLQTESIPLIIDNGSYHCRVGWATKLHPYLNFKNVIAKNRGNRKEKDWDIQVANEIADLETVRWLLRTPYDFNVVVNYSVQETLLDYAFKHLGISTDGCINHPLVLTEAIANPSYCRKQMSELLFECYCIPKLAYGIDCLFSNGYNMPEFDLPEVGLIVSSGFQSTHVLPVFGKKADIKNCCRINLGGYNCSAYMQRLLQFKHPQLVSELTLSRMDEVVHGLCHVAPNYQEEITKCFDIGFKDKHATTLQFSSSTTPSNIKTGNILGGPLKLEKKLKQAEHKLYELECVIELEQESTEAAEKVAADAGCSSIKELKEKTELIRDNIQAIRRDLDEQYRLDKVATGTVKCGIEKCQAPEIIFQPSLVGYNQSGLSECIEMLLENYSKEVQELMAKNIFITGGNTKIDGFRERVVKDMIQIRPYQSEIIVRQAANPSLDAWRGAAKWALSQHCNWMERKDFEECGWEYLKEHNFSNMHVATKSTT
ncbi:unnamed protein product [Clavelina lepadiformis]|uniref:Actin-related protein 5 n=1 Tax=Clavelina lepadiformis TaxID=159417 RepID=A0ABP0GW08_CLALP